VKRSVEEPGRPKGVGKKKSNSARESITLSWPLRESDRLIVAGKRVTTVERRGLNEDVLMEERGRTAWIKVPLRKN